jgi:hypothetical protein
MRGGTEMTINYTPGPWAVYPCEDDPYGDIIVGKKGRNVCLLWLDDAPVEDYNDAQHANARLIAAAPEMYESLKKIKCLAEEDNFDDEFRAEAAAIVCEMLEKLK